MRNKGTIRKKNRKLVGDFEEIQSNKISTWVEEEREGANKNLVIFLGQFSESNLGNNKLHKQLCWNNRL